MSVTVTLCSDRNGFHTRWRSALQHHGLRARTCMPDELAEAAQAGHGVVIDAGAGALDEDELLTTVGFLCGIGALPVVQLADHGPMSAADDVIAEMCAGLVVRSEEDPARAAGCLARRLDGHRSKRFEFVTLSPRSDEVLAILGNGRASLLRRPLVDEDDGSDVVQITLAENAGEATLELASGAQITLQAAALAKVTAPQVNGAAHPNGLAIDGTRLGARLRELRLEAGLTQAELARRTGIHRPNIARVEAGRHTPSLETLARLATAMGVPTTRVLSED
jgi:DNA-binding XRE family transcriptional regulator